MAQVDLPEYTDQPTLRLNEFEGPLEVLLQLIKQSEMDIYDIEISSITAQYMDFLHQQQARQLDIAGEYFVMAATLMAIKSEMLLPKPPVMDEEVDEEVADPRDELVQQLLEYQRYKQAAEKLKDREEYRQQEFTREAMAVPKDLIQASFAPGVSLDQLQAAFAKVVKRHHLVEPATQTVSSEPITVAQRIAVVLEKVTQPTRFEDLFADDYSRDNLITTFMAILDLAKHRAVRIEQSEYLGPLIVLPGERKAEYQHG